MRTDLTQVFLGNHILAIYHDNESKFDEAFKFLKQGLDNDEIIMIVTDSLTKNEISKRMEKEWNIKIEKFTSRGVINMNTVDECHYQNGFPKPFSIKAFWGAMAEIARTRGMRGFRVFADTHSFFEKGHAAELVNYESILESKFSIPFTAICAYDSKDLQSLTPEQRSALLTHHNPVWN